ncbi:MAG: tripartite tricarboxylate transporter TctB family protein [Pseudomonadota bacterium]
MRIAELLMSVALAALALAVMYKAGERPSWSGEARFSNVGFGETGSPSGGFWPFWVAAIMFLCCVWTFINGILRRTKPSRTEGPFLDRHGILVLLTVGVPVFLLVFLTDYISMYFSMAVFLFYYLFVLGRHGLILSTAMAAVFPFWLYLFFDITMTRTLPKGSLAIEDAIFTPLGNWFRQADGWVTGVFFLAGAVVIVLAAILSSRRKGDA